LYLFIFVTKKISQVGVTYAKYQSTNATGTQYKTEQQ